MFFLRQPPILTVGFSERSEKRETEFTVSRWFSLLGKRKLFQPARDWGVAPSAGCSLAQYAWSSGIIHTEVSTECRPAPVCIGGGCGCVGVRWRPEALRKSGPSSTTEEFKTDIGDPVSKQNPLKANTP